MKTTKFFLLCVLSCFFISFFSGCLKGPYFYQKNKGILSGFYHTVKHGDTLWSISQIYGITLKDLSKWNHLNSLNKIKENQLLFIPRSIKQRKHLLALERKESLFVKIPHKIFGAPLNVPVHTYKNFLKDKGLSIKAPQGSTVFASRSGYVVFSNLVKGMGYVILIQHEKKYTTVYAHLEKTFVCQNDIIKKGQSIGILKKHKKKGQSVLRFEIRKNGIILSPLLFFL